MLDKFHNFATLGSLCMDLVQIEKCVAVFLDTIKTESLLTSFFFSNCSSEYCGMSGQNNNNLLTKQIPTISASHQKLLHSILNRERV